MATRIMLLMATVAIGTAATVAAGSSSSSLRKTTNAVVIPPVYDNNSLKVVSNNDSRATTLTMMTSHHSHHHGGSSSNPNDNKNNSNNKVGEFDFYVFSMSYQPEFCHESMKEQYTGCMTYNKSWEGQLTIHGLWPNRNDGSYPTQCSHENLMPNHLAGLENDMEQKWPNVKSPTTSSSYQSWSMSDTSFWGHEWDKHGTCSDMDQHTYFYTALQLLLPTPTIIKESYDSNSGDGGGVVTRSELIAGYATSNTSTSKDTVLVCSKRGFLSEVRVCYEKKTKTSNNINNNNSASNSENGSGSGNVGKRISCPDVILKEDSCGETIKIASFNEHELNVVATYL